MGKWRRRRERVHHQAQSSDIKEYRIDPSLECWPDGGALLRRRRGRCLRVCLMLVMLVVLVLLLLLMHDG